MTDEQCIHIPANMITHDEIFDYNSNSILMMYKSCSKSWQDKNNEAVGIHFVHSISSFMHIYQMEVTIYCYSISSFMHIYQMEVTIYCLCCTITKKIVMITSNTFIAKCVFFVACSRYFQLCLSESVQIFRK